MNVRGEETVKGSKTEYGTNFREVRKINGYTQEQIADYLEVDRSLIAKFESNERSMPVAKIQRACRLFGCELSAIDGTEQYKPLATAFRAKELSKDDMESVGAIQKIVLNMRIMKQLMGKEGIH